MMTSQKPREDFTNFDVIRDYTLNKVNFMDKWHLLTLRSGITYVGVKFSFSTYFQDNYYQLPHKIRLLDKFFVSQHYILNKLNSFSSELCCKIWDKLSLLLKEFMQE